MVVRSPRLVPQPKCLSAQTGRLTLDENTWIVLLPSSGEPEFLSARSLQAEIREATGLTTPIVKTAQLARHHNLILLTADDVSASGYWGEAMPWGEKLADRGSQAYGVSITPRRAIAGGQGTTALHHAVQTLRQLVRLEHARLPALEIVDWPSLPFRGLMLDVSRGKVPTLATLKHLVQVLSSYKLNVLQLYTEHTFVFPRHPRIGQDCGSLSGEEMLELDAYARQHHVELMPNLNSFGHCAHLLNLPDYAHLAESAAARWSLCPSDEETYELLAELYDDFLPNFESTSLNVGCDETWDLGTGRSAERVHALGRGRVYLEHILRLCELAASHGRSIQIWGDILLHYPELVPELPDDVTLLDWHYDASDDYPSVKTFAQSGRDFWVCPGTSTWNTLFPRIENALGNICTLARLGAAHGASGLLNTDWGDHGHYQPLGQCWHGYVYGAEESWTGGATEEADFDAAFGPLFFGASGERIVGAMRRLGRLNVLPGMARRNASQSIYALLDEPLLGEISAQIPGSTLDEIVSTCDEVEAEMRSALAGTRDRLSVEEMIYSTRLMRYAALKVQTVLAIRAGLEKLAEGEGEPIECLSKDIRLLRDLDTQLVDLIGRFRELWLLRARPAEMRITLEQLEGVRERYGASVAWLATLLEQVLAGQKPKYALSDYASRVGRYEILGQALARRMREAGVSYG